MISLSCDESKKMLVINRLPSNDAVQKQKKMFIRGSFSSVVSQFKNYHPSGNPKNNSLGIFQSLELRILVEKFF